MNGNPIRVLTALALLLLPAACDKVPEVEAGKGAAETASRLFILSGQSNMVRLNPAGSFRPTLEKAFPAEEIIIVKAAWNGQPIRRWYREWRDAEGAQPARTGNLYRHLMKKVRKAMAGKTPVTVTVVWMQGEADAREGNGEVYAGSLHGLFDQLRQDLGRDDIHFVVGRISDFDNENRQRPHWTLVRGQQAEAVAAEPAAVLVDTDDLNGPHDDLHYTPEGFTLLGRRFAEAAIGQLQRGPEHARSYPPTSRDHSGRDAGIQAPWRAGFAFPAGWIPSSMTE